LGTVGVTKTGELIFCWKRSQKKGSLLESACKGKGRGLTGVGKWKFPGGRSPRANGGHENGRKLVETRSREEWGKAGRISVCQEKKKMTMARRQGFSKCGESTPGRVMPDLL